MINDELYPILDKYEYLLKESGAICKQDENNFMSNDHLLWMISEMRNFDWDKYGKFCRWLGFIQGLMCERKMLSVMAERNFTRKFFADEMDWMIQYERK